MKPDGLLLYLLNFLKENAAKSKKRTDNDNLT